MRRGGSLSVDFAPCLLRSHSEVLGLKSAAEELKDSGHTRIICKSEAVHTCKPRSDHQTVGFISSYDQVACARNAMRPI